MNLSDDSKQGRCADPQFSLEISPQFSSSLTPELQNDSSATIVNTSVSYLEACLFITALEDAITQLRILVECNNELRIIKAKSDMNQLLAKKYSIKQAESVDELEGIDLQNLGCNEYKISKLDYDRKFVTDALLATYVNLCQAKNFSALYNVVNDIVGRDTYRERLKIVESKNKVLRRDLNKQLRQQRNHFKSVIYDTDTKVDLLKTEVEDSVLNSECRSRYVDRWQVARTEQHIQTIRDKESLYSDNVEYYKQRNDHEQRVHMEIEMLINIHINETMQKVENWMNKYDRDMEAIDLKIQIKKNEYQDMYSKRLELTATIEKHDKLMKDWVHFKDEREKARQYREKMTKSAIAVQAWWRGLLVRLQLGPYKVAKKGKGKKK